MRIGRLTEPADAEEGCLADVVRIRARIFGGEQRGEDRSWNGLGQVEIECWGVEGPRGGEEGDMELDVGDFGGAVGGGREGDV